MVKNSPSKARDTGLIPGHILHTTGQLSLHTTTREGHAPQLRPSTVKNKSLLKKKKKLRGEVSRGQIINIFPCNAKKLRFIK